MSRSTAAVMLLLLPATASAAAGCVLPWNRTVWVDSTITIEQEYPDYEFYLLTSYDIGQRADRVPLTPATPIQVLAGDRPPAWAQFFAVKKQLRPAFGDRPTLEWLWENEGRGVVRAKMPDSNDYIRFSRPLPLTDNRAVIEVVLRFELGPDGGRLVQVSENAGAPRVWWSWVVAGTLAAVAFIGLGLWLPRRIRR
jgi:hypothetical protein